MQSLPFDDVILMENVAHEMSVVELVYDFIVDFLRQFFKPVAVVAAQGDVQRDQIFHFVVMHGAVADGGGSDGKTVQHGGLGFFGCAFEKTRRRGVQNTLSGNARASSTPFPPIFKIRWCSYLSR